MSTSVIQVLDVFAAAAAPLDDFKGVEDKSNTTSRLRLHGRITIPSRGDSFDTVRLLLHGAVGSTIGSQVAVESLGPTTEVRTSQDFKPSSTATQRGSEARHLDFICSVPCVGSKRRGRCLSNDGIVPSMSISGSTYVTRVTALRDRHLLEGRCDVSYWLEAEFLRSGSKQPVRRLSCPVDISSLLTPLDVEVVSSDPSHHIQQTAKPQLRSLSRFLTSQPQPELSLTLPKKLGCIESDLSRSVTGSRQVSIPVSVCVKVPVHALRSGEVQGLKCSVKAQWHTKRTFTTGSSAVESVVHSDRVSTQTLAITSPPLYSSGPGTSTYTTSIDLGLVLPECVSSPSVSTDLLAISYTLDLSMRFEFGANEAVKSPYAAEFRLPLVLRNAKPQSIPTRHYGSEYLFGYFEEDVLHALPPYVC